MSNGPGVARPTRATAPDRSAVGSSAVSDPAFRRVLIKLSGESLMGELDYGTDPERLRAVADKV